jgi:uncharacterized protein (DUF1501 family)
MNTVDRSVREITRRYFFRQSGFGIGTLALASLLEQSGFGHEATTTSNPLAARPPHFGPRTRNIIFLFMCGGPSQIDLLDPKPKLIELHGQSVPAAVIEGERFAFITGRPKLLASPYTFAKCGDSGIEVSALLPHLATMVDEIAVVRSLHTNEFNHGPAQIYMNAGDARGGRPSMGAWMTYGLGSENENLPGFVVLLSGNATPDAGPSCWGSGFLPTAYQGVPLRTTGEPVLFLSNPDGVSREARRATLDLARELNRARIAITGDPEIATRIASYEMAYRMQSSVPELMDLSRETKQTHEMYGTEPGKTSFANNCLMARRLVERGVRFVQLYHRGWDHHGSSMDNDLIHSLPALCRETDRASAALVRDLKDRGLLDSTLVVWGGEFGRTPMVENRDGASFIGRDHHPRAFTMWLAGGGIKRGVTIGRTDELGYRAVEDPVHVHDLHATILHLMGLDHTRLTYRFQGRDFRLTDVEGRVVQQLLA